MILEMCGTKFLRSKYSALDGKTTVSFEEQSGEDRPFRMIANQEGLWFTGTMIKKLTTMDELQDFAKLTSMAWTEHTKLRPKLSTNFKETSV